MADIDVVKKGSSTWLWVVLAIVLVLLAWWFLMGTNDTTRVGFLFESVEGLTV